GTFAVFGDVDNDGDLDVLISYSNDVTKESSASYIYLKEEIGFVRTMQAFPSISNNNSFHWVDFNNDGYLDLWFMPESYFLPQALSIYLNDKTGRFTLAKDFEIDLSAYQDPQLFWEDIDRDGDLDLLVQSFSYSYERTI